MPKEPVAHKLAVADCVVLGKIAAIHPKSVPGQVWRYSPTPKWEFTVVEVEVQERFHGPKDNKRVRFGIRDTKAYKPVPAVGQTGCFYGVQVGMNDFYVVPLDCFSAGTGAGFANELAQVRRAGRLLGNLQEGLKSKDPDDRVLAAHLLILRCAFAPFRYGETGKSEPIDADQSKRALLALADADWTKHGGEIKESLTWLQWAAKYGAPPPNNFPLDRGDGKWPTAARQWLRENAVSFRIHRIGKASPGVHKK